MPGLRFSHFRLGLSIVRSGLIASLFGIALAGAANAAPTEAHLYEQAVAARQAKEFTTAAGLFEQALRINPRNADAQVLLGYSYLALGEMQKAETAFDATLRIAPDYQDARLGKAQIAYRIGDRASASALVDLVLSEQPENADAIALRERLDAPPPPKWRLDTGGEFHALTGGRPNWYEATTTLSYTFDQGTVLAGTVRVANRGALTDTQLTGRIDQVFSPAVSAFGLLAITPDADFIPALSLALGTRLEIVSGDDLPGTIALNAQIKTDFGASGTISTVRIGPQFAFLNDTFSLLAEWLHGMSNSGVTTDGVLMRLDAQLTDKLRGNIGYSFAPEISGATIDNAQSLFAGLSYDADDMLILRINVAREFRSAYERSSISLGLTKRF